MVHKSINLGWPDLACLIENSTKRDPEYHWTKQNPVLRIRNDLIRKQYPLYLPDIFNLPLIGWPRQIRECHGKIISFLGNTADMTTMHYVEFYTFGSDGRQDFQVVMKGRFDSNHGIY